VREYLLGEGLVASTGELWRRQRKLMAPFFTPKGVQAYAELMIRDGARLVERWQALAGKGAEVEISEEMTLVTASIILRAMFSSETMESIHQMKDAVNTMCCGSTRRRRSTCGTPSAPTRSAASTCPRARR
jgi:cytochrome P450